MSYSSSKKEQISIDYVNNLGKENNYDPVLSKYQNCVHLNNQRTNDKRAYATIFFESYISHYSGTAGEGLAPWIPNSVLDVNNIKLKIRARTDDTGNLQGVDGVGLMLLGNTAADATNAYQFFTHGHFGGSGGLALYDGTTMRNFGFIDNPTDWHDIEFHMKTGMIDCYIDGLPKSTGVTQYTPRSFTSPNGLNISIGRRGFYDDQANLLVSDFYLESSGVPLVHWDFTEGTGEYVYNKIQNEYFGAAARIRYCYDPAWRYKDDNVVPKKTNFAIQQNSLISTGLHLVECNSIEVPTSKSLIGDGNKYETIFRPSLSYASGRLDPALDMTLNRYGSGVTLAYNNIRSGSTVLNGTIVSGLNIDTYNNDGPAPGYNGYTSFSGGTHIVIPKNSLHEFQGNFNLSLWMRTPSGYNPTGIVGIINQYDGGSTSGWEFNVNGINDRLQFILRGSTTRAFDNTTYGSGYTDGKWHHHSISLYKKYAAWFIDGELSFSSGFSSATTANFASKDIWIGRRQGSTEAFRGDICGVKLFYTPLLRGEISNIYENKSDCIIKSEGLKTYSKSNYTGTYVPSQMVIKNITLHGNGTNSGIQLTSNTGMPFRVDGINLLANGYEVSDVFMHRFEGNGMYLASKKPKSGSTKIYDLDSSKVFNCYATNCYNGCVIENNYNTFINNFVAGNCRDHGIDIINSSGTNLNDISIYDTAVGVKFGRGSQAYAGKIQATNCNAGIVIDTPNVNIDQLVAKECRFVAADILRPNATISQCHITLPPANSSNTGILTGLPLTWIDYNIPYNYYNTGGQSWGPIGIRLRKEAEGCNLTNIKIDSSATGALADKTIGLQISSPKNYIRGRVKNMTIGAYIDSASAHDNNIELYIENCTSGVVVAAGANGAEGSNITIYFKNISSIDGTSMIWDLTPAKAWTTANNITEIQLT